MAEPRLPMHSQIGKGWRFATRRVAARCLALSLAYCGVATAGERMAFEGSDVTVEAPGGSMVMANDASSLHLNVCDPAVADGCQVLAQMYVEKLSGGREPASLDAVFRTASAVSADNPVPARRIKVAGYDAVETASLGDVNYNYGGGRGDTAKMAYRAITLQAGAAFYRCGISASPDADWAHWRGALHEFCSSLRIGTK